MILHDGCVLCAIVEHPGVRDGGLERDMTGDDWILKVRKDREAAEEKAAVEAKMKLENRRVYEAKADGLWGRIVAEVERVVAIYNDSSLPAYRVEVEKLGATEVEINWMHSAIARIGINNRSQDVSGLRRWYRED